MLNDVLGEDSIHFEVDDELYPLLREQATVLAESLRLTAVGEYGEHPGMEGAEAVADLIEDTLVDRRFGPIPLDGEEAEAVFYALDASIANPDAEVYRLYRAVRDLHHALEE